MNELIAFGSDHHHTEAAIRASWLTRRCRRDSQMVHCKERFGRRLIPAVDRDDMPWPASHAMRGCDLVLNPPRVPYENPKKSENNERLAQIMAAPLHNPLPHNMQINEDASGVQTKTLKNPSESSCASTTTTSCCVRAANEEGLRASAAHHHRHRGWRGGAHDDRWAGGLSRRTYFTTTWGKGTSTGVRIRQATASNRRSRSATPRVPRRGRGRKEG